jgi:hypothetical protein
VAVAVQLATRALHELLVQVFEVGIFDFDCKLFVGFNVNSFIDLTERSSAQFFENFKLFCHNGVNHNSERFLK